MIEVLAWPKSFSEWIVLIVVSIFFSIGGVTHFTNSAFYISIMPPQVPFPKFWVYFTGICEIIGVLGLWLTVTRVWAAWSLVGLCVAVFPANIYMALNPNQFSQFSIGALYLRLPLQFVIIYSCYYLTLNR